MVGLLIIAHDDVGTALLKTAAHTLGICPLRVEVLSIGADSDPDRMEERACASIRKLDQGDGVLVLTDMYGSTPCNIAARLVDAHRVRVVSGINLPMLIRVMNYPRMALDELALKAESGGRDGIFPLKAKAGP